MEKIKIKLDNVVTFRLTFAEYLRINQILDKVKTETIIPIDSEKEFIITLTYDNFKQFTEYLTDNKVYLDNILDTFKIMEDSNHYNM